MPTDPSSVEASVDDYKEENYDIINSKEVDYASFPDETDLLVNIVEQLNQNEFVVEAYLVKSFNDTDEFRERFKSYIESTYSFNQLFPDTKITVKLINATDKGNETLICFHLKTFNIVISDSDLTLESYSIFDQIFDNFDIYEFESYFENGNEIEQEANVETEDIEVTTVNHQPTVNETPEMATNEIALLDSKFFVIPISDNETQEKIQSE